MGDPSKSSNVLDYVGDTAFCMVADSKYTLYDIIIHFLNGLVRMCYSYFIILLLITF